MSDKTFRTLIGIGVGVVLGLIFIVFKNAIWFLIIVGFVVLFFIQVCRKLWP